MEARGRRSSRGGVVVQSASPHTAAAIAVSLRSRREEIGQMVVARAHAIDAPGLDVDAEYLEGLRLAIEAAIDDTIEALGGGAGSLPVPAPILSQARLAARRRVPLETMLRRYLAGHAILGDFVVEEAGRQGVPPETLRGAMRFQAARTDEALAAISTCYVEEVRAARPLSTDRRRAEQVRRLLDGELVDPSALAYGLEGWHIGFVFQGPGRDEAVGDVTRPLDARRLVVAADDETAWVWAGLRDRPGAQQVQPALGSDVPDGLRVGVGEPGEGPAGWRLTHEQARAALSVAVRRPATILQYRDVALVAAAMKDELLSTSLSQLYLEPLEEDKENRRELQATLRAYFDADQSVTSTAASLGISRNTVTNRLRAIEARVGYLQPIRSAQLLVALGLGELAPAREQIAQR
jgi:hypothetical protein